MATNPIFPNLISAKEQSLLASLNREAIQIYGVDCLYLPRTVGRIDSILNEAQSADFTFTIPIEMFVKTMDSFEGEGDLLSKFGVEIRDQMVMTVSKGAFEDAIANTAFTHSRPMEGDCVFFPLNGKIFEIKHVEHEVPFYQLGKQYVYDVRMELFEYSGETFTTGNATIDAMFNNDVNILPNPIDFTQWTHYEVAFVGNKPAPDGSNSAVHVSGTAEYAYMYDTIRPGTLSIGDKYTYSIHVKKQARRLHLGLDYFGDTNYEYYSIEIDAATGLVTGSSAANIPLHVEDLGDYFRVGITGAVTLPEQDGIWVYIYLTAFDQFGTLVYTDGPTVWGAQLERGEMTAFVAPEASEYVQGFDPLADNEDIQTASDAILDFSETDPFSEGGRF